MLLGTMPLELWMASLQAQALLRQPAQVLPVIQLQNICMCAQQLSRPAPRWHVCVPCQVLLVSLMRMMSKSGTQLAYEHAFVNTYNAGTESDDPARAASLAHQGSPRPDHCGMGPQSVSDAAAHAAPLEAVAAERSSEADGELGTVDSALDAVLLKLRASAEHALSGSGGATHSRCSSGAERSWRAAGLGARAATEAPTEGSASIRRPLPVLADCVATSDAQQAAASLPSPRLLHASDTVQTRTATAHGLPGTVVQVESSAASVMALPRVAADEQVAEATLQRTLALQGRLGRATDASAALGAAQLAAEPQPTDLSSSSAPRRLGVWRTALSGMRKRRL